MVLFDLNLPYYILLSICTIWFLFFLAFCINYLSFIIPFYILLIGCFNIHLCLFFSGCGHPAEVGWTPTQNFVQIPRLQTLLKPREFERKFITHTGEPLGRVGWAQAGPGCLGHSRGGFVGWN